MPVSNRVYSSAMRRFSGAVTLIATEFEGERSALTATSVCSLAVSPPRLLACVNLHGHTFSLLEKSQCMSVNILAAEQEQLARRFAGMHGSRRDNHFVNGTWRSQVTGAPVFVDGIAAFDCRLIQMFKLDSHAILIGQVEHVALGEQRDPLLYSHGAFITTRALSQSAG